MLARVKAHGGEVGAGAVPGVASDSASVGVDEVGVEVGAVQGLRVVPVVVGRAVTCEQEVVGRADQSEEDDERDANVPLALIADGMVADPALGFGEVPAVLPGLTGVGAEQGQD